MSEKLPIVIIGAGPAGLMAAERLARSGRAVAIFDRMPSPARKFLMAGRGGLNLTHSEPMPLFLDRYRPRAPALEAAVQAFDSAALRSFVAELGEETFVGSSGRVFPRSFKASPLLRAWLRRLDAMDVTLHLRHDWRGWSDEGHLLFATPTGERTVAAEATILALGGASWPRLGSDGGWAPLLSARGVAVTPFSPANMGVRVKWSDMFSERFAGAPLKRIRLTAGGGSVMGEAVVTSSGLEGGLIYALSAGIRDAVTRDGQAELRFDLRPDLAQAVLAARIAAVPASQSLSTRLRKGAGLSPVAMGLLREAGLLPTSPEALAARIKALPITATGIAGLERAISSAGGIAWEGLDERFMLKALPGIFACGEMLDWEAPTGGYLLQASFATGWAAAGGLLAS